MIRHKSKTKEKVEDLRQRTWRLEKKIHKKIDKAVGKTDMSENAWANKFLDEKLE